MKKNVIDKLMEFLESPSLAMGAFLSFFISMVLFISDHDSSAQIEPAIIADIFRVITGSISLGSLLLFVLGVNEAWSYLSGRKKPAKNSDVKPLATSVNRLDSDRSGLQAENKVEHRHEDILPEEEKIIIEKTIYGSQEQHYSDSDIESLLDSDIRHLWYDACHWYFPIQRESIYAEARRLLKQKGHFSIEIEVPQVCDTCAGNDRIPESSCWGACDCHYPKVRIMDKP